MSINRTQWIIKFTNIIESVVNQLPAIVQTKTWMERKRELLRGLTKDFCVPAQIILSSYKCYGEAMTDLEVFETT